MNISNISSSLHFPFIPTMVTFTSRFKYKFLTSIEYLEYFYTVVLVLLCRYRTWKSPQRLWAFFKNTIFPSDAKWSPSKKQQKIGHLSILKVRILLLIFHSHFAPNTFVLLFIHFTYNWKKSYCIALKDKRWCQYACHKSPDNHQINEDVIS